MVKTTEIKIEPIKPFGVPNGFIVSTKGKSATTETNSKKATPRKIFYPKRSLIWNYFEEVETNLVKCKLCGVTMSLNMSRHLKRSHPKDYSKMQVLKAKCRQKGVGHFGNRRNSSAWAYFDTIKQNKVRCRLCTSIISGNMYSHLRMRHPITYLKCRKIRSKIGVAVAKEAMKSRQLIRRGRGLKSNMLWEYFDDLGSRSVRCQLCDLTIRPNSMTRHLRTKHPKAYAQYEEHKLVIVSDDIEDKPVSKPKLSLNTYLRRMCTRVGDGYYQCNICKRELRLTKDNLWTLRRHISKKHPIRYDELMKQFTENTSTYNKNVKEKYWIKQHYKVVDKGVYKCNLCEVKLKLSYGYLDNMRRHIKELHQKAYEKEQKEEIIESNSVAEDEVDYVVEYIDTDNFENIESTANILVDKSLQEANLSQVSSDEDSGCLEQHSNFDDSEPIQKEPVLVQELVNLANEIDNELMSINDPHLENKIKILCQTPVKGKRFSCIWNFYKVVIQNRVYACLFCNRDISIGPGGIGNLRRHISLKHKKQYEMIMKYEVVKKSNTDDEQSEMPNSNEAKTERSVSFEVKENHFICKLCETILVYSDEKDVVLKHIAEHHPDQGAISHDGDQITIIAIEQSE